ncbi:MAG: hypothetical protein ABIG95_00065 [Candidatus Woesearchaeota archaeon]
MKRVALPRQNILFPDRRLEIDDDIIGAALYYLVVSALYNVERQMGKKAPRIRFAPGMDLPNEPPRAKARGI